MYFYEKHFFFEERLTQLNVRLKKQSIIMFSQKGYFFVKYLKMTISNSSNIRIFPLICILQKT